MIETVGLTRWEYDIACHVAEQRHAATRGTQNSPTYQANLNRMEDNLQAEIAGACCEMAVAKYLGRYWSAGWWDPEEHAAYSQIPDVMPDYEVKRIRDKKHNLIVKEKYVQLGFNMVLAYTYPDDKLLVDLVGWIPAWQAWHEGEQASWDSTGTLRIFPQSRLIGMEHAPS